MTVTVNHAKTNAISDWTQAQLDEQIALGNFPAGTTLANIVLPSDWNNDHTLTGLGTMAEQNANSVAITGGSVNGTTIGATTASTGKFTSVTTPSVTATTNDLTLSAISTGAVNLATANGTQVKVINSGDGARTLNLYGGNTGGTLLPTLFSTVGSMQIASGTSASIRFQTNATSNTDGIEQARVSHTASAVNYVQVTGAATSANPVISAQGSDSTVNLSFQRKGNGNFQFLGPVILGSNAVNYWQTSGAATTLVPQLQVLGSDTNISMAFQPKGTGAIDLAAGSRGVNISNGGTVTAITRTANGTGYTSFPTVNITAPTTAGGVQAVATLVNMQSIGASISAGGTGYTVGNVITITGGTPVTVAATFTVSAVSSGVVTAVTALNFAPYTVLPTAPVSTTGGSGTGLTLTDLTWAIGSSFTISNAGSGYIEQPTITFSGGGGSGASAFASVGSLPTVRSLHTEMQFHTAGGIGFEIQTFGAGTSTSRLATFASSSGNPTILEPRGTTNIDSVYSSRGTGVIRFTTNSFSLGTGAEQLRVAHTASAVNYVQVTGAATDVQPTITMQGSDANIGVKYRTKGTFNHEFQNGNSNNGFVINLTSGTVLANYIEVAPKIAGTSPVISALGTDTNIDLTLTPKGTGLIRFGTYVAGALLATGYINIKAADGTTYKVLVST